MADHAPRVTACRRILLIGLITQLALVVIGTLSLYSSSRPYIKHRFWNALLWSIVGPPGMMFLAVQWTLPVIAFLLLLVFAGFRWKRVGLFGVVSAILWGVWWLLGIYVLCVMQKD